MDRLLINGGRRLKGSVELSGAKNAVLPIMAATILSEGTCVIKNVPNLQDVRTMVKLLTALGAKIRYGRDKTLTVDASCVNKNRAPYELVSTMRASVCVLGPLLARFGEAYVAHPGGCVIGPRPIDLHLRGLKKLGASVSIEHGDIVAKGALTGNNIYLGGSFGSTVLGTANLMMASTTANGVTTIEGAACEPEIQDLARFLVQMGAKIKGAGTHRLVIEGVERLRAAEYTVMRDRIEAGTYIIAGAITDGDIEVVGADTECLGAFIDRIEEAGARVRKTDSGVHVSTDGSLRSVDVTTMPYPGFPTDMQAQIMVFLLKADGIGLIYERIYPDRFMHVSELLRMGAGIIREGPRAIVKGGGRLSGAPVMASDLRASAALVLAGLIAEGQTTISRIYHLDRGYERIDEKLGSLGADIRRVK